jgi:hypothetical protein
VVGDSELLGAEITPTSVPKLLDCFAAPWRPGRPRCDLDSLTAWFFERFLS